MFQERRGAQEGGWNPWRGRWPAVWSWRHPHPRRCAARVGPLRGPTPQAGEVEVVSSAARRVRARDGLVHAMPMPVASIRRRLKPAEDAPRSGRRRPSLPARACRRTAMAQTMPAPLRRVGQQPRLGHPPRDVPQPVRPVPHRIESGHPAQQHLGGADVGRRLLRRMSFARASAAPTASRRRVDRHADSGPACAA